MKNEKWIDDISTMMDGYEMAAPEVSLSEIEARVAAKRRARIIPLWRKHIAIAASLLAFGVLVATMMRQEDGGITETKSPASSLNRNSVGTGNRQHAITEARNIAITPNRKIAITQNRNNVITSLRDGETTPSLAAEAPKIAPSQPQSPSQKEATSPQKKRKQLPATGDYAPKRKQRQRRLLAGVYMGNGLGNSQFTPTPMMTYAASTYGASLVDMVEGEVYVMQNASIGEKRRNVDHSQPIRFGVSLKYGLTDRWSVSTGLTYTYLRSDITEESSAFTLQAKQRIGYIGVPLSASYTFFASRSIDAYVSAGMAVDVPIAAKADETTISNGIVTAERSRSLSKSALQLSAMLSLGAEYRFADNLGVYVEPGLGYYFDNGSRLETIYQDKPLNFNLNLGLRYTIK